jgi:hypothetical protein
MSNPSGGIGQLLELVAVSTGTGRRGFGRGNQHNDARRGWGPFIGLGWEVRWPEAVNGWRQSGTSMPSKFWFWDVMERGGCAGYWRGRGGLEWHLSCAWKRWLDGTAVRQRMAVAGGGGVIICPRKRMSSIGSARLKKPSWPRGQLGQGVVADLTFYAFVNKKSKIERL